jgi:hypothetical protein
MTGAIRIIDQQDRVLFLLQPLPKSVAIDSPRRQTIEYACFAPDIVPTACWKASSETAVTSTLSEPPIRFWITAGGSASRARLWFRLRL